MSIKENPLPPLHEKSQKYLRVEIDEEKLRVKPIIKGKWLTILFSILTIGQGTFLLIWMSLGRIANLPIFFPLILLLVGILVSIYARWSPVKPFTINFGNERFTQQKVELPLS